MGEVWTSQRFSLGRIHVSPGGAENLACEGAHSDHVPILSAAGGCLLLACTWSAEPEHSMPCVWVHSHSRFPCLLSIWSHLVACSLRNRCGWDSWATSQLPSFYCMVMLFSICADPCMQFTQSHPASRRISPMLYSYTSNFYWSWIYFLHKPVTKAE